MGDPGPRPRSRRGVETWPVLPTEAVGGYHVVTRYEDVRRVLEDPVTLSSAQVSVKPVPIHIPPLDADPSPQQDFRRFLNPFFSRSHLLCFEPEMRRIAAIAIESWLAAGRCEFAVPFSAGILARIVFDETDEERVTEAVRGINRIAFDQSPEAFFDVAMLCARNLDEREESGHDGRPAGALPTATVEGGRPLTEDERLGVVIVLFLGGLDTTRAAIGNTMVHIIEIPSIESRLRTRAGSPKTWRSSSGSSRR